ncbi:MAG: hypothetical protein GEV03_07540 [Streptosporangiales bacterium]|nr:hypothetical protein [Streptosporangiales bacterium]
MTAEIDKTARGARSSGPARVRIWRRIEWVDTDKSGYWHFASAFRLFEAAETTLWQHLGGKEQLGDIPRVHVTASFRKKVLYLDVVAVDLLVERIGRSSVSYSITISRDGELCVEGEMVVAAVDPASGDTQPIPDDIRRALESVGELTEDMPPGAGR